MMGRWWRCALALALVLGGITAAPRAHAEGYAEVCHAGALAPGGVAAVKRVKAERGVARATCSSVRGLALASFAIPAPVRTCVRLPPGAALGARPADPPRSAPARDPPA